MSAHLAYCAQTQRETARVPVDVVGDEAGHEEVAVVVAVLHAGASASGRLRGTPVQAVLASAVRRGTGRRVPGRRGCRRNSRAMTPSRRSSHASWPRHVSRSGAEIGGEGFLAPRAVHRRRDRREGGDRAEEIRMAQRQRQRAVAAHRMARDAELHRVGGKACADQRIEVARDVGFHTGSAAPTAPVWRRHRSPRPAPDHRPGSLATLSPRGRCIGRDDHHAVRGGGGIGAGLCGEIVFGAGEAGQPEREPGRGRGLRA